MPWQIIMHRIISFHLFEGNLLEDVHVQEQVHPYLCNASMSEAHQSMIMYFASTHAQRAPEGHKV